MDEEQSSATGKNVAWGSRETIHQQRTLYGVSIHLEETILPIVRLDARVQFALERHGLAS